MRKLISVALFVSLGLGSACCMDIGTREKRFRKRMLCAQRVNNENSIFILKSGAFCCPKLPQEVNDILSAKAWYYRKALEISPDRVEGWASLGQTLWELGKYGDSAEAFSRALDLSPGTLHFLIALETVERIRGDRQEALRYIGLIEKRPFKDKEKTVAYLKGKLFYEEGRLDEAIVSLESAKAAMEEPKGSHFLGPTPFSMRDVYFYLAQAYFKRGEAQKAHELFLTYIAKEGHPDFVAFYERSLQESGGEQAILYDIVESGWASTRQ